MALKKHLKSIAVFAVGLFYVHLYRLLRQVDIEQTGELFFIGNRALKWEPLQTNASPHALEQTESGENGEFHLRTISLNTSIVKDRGELKTLKSSLRKSAGKVPKDSALALSEGRSMSGPRCFRTVHLWANFAGELGFPHGEQNILCPGSKCDVRLTVDMSFSTMQKNEALVMYHWTSWDWNKMHQHRPPGQKWVFYTLESPRNTRKHVIPPDQYYNTSYNYIMSFRYDSDIRADYGQYIDGKPEIPADDSRNWATGRTKLVAWMASNCKGTTWPRLDFVKNLAKYLPVGMYGRCGNLTCRAGSKSCDDSLAQYKFYLALENSECTDYITEKFWIQSLVRNLVPIVYGPPRTDYEKVAPPGSFIHIQDFATIKELAEYLKRVDADDALYGKFFEWKKKGSLKPYGKGPNIMCQLGDLIVRDEVAVAQGNYTAPTLPDWKSWWGDSCKRRGKLPQ